MRFWQQVEHQTIFNLLKLEVVAVVVVVVVALSKSGGPQKWLVPSGTDVHRVARTIDVCTVEQESHRQTKMIM
jgi:hypothetical protein